jgi:hypothetical protein
MLKVRLLTRRDISISLILSIGSLGISIGLIGTKNLLITALFFIVPLILTLVLFLIYKPTNPRFDDNKKGY